jgi:predicted RNase H-like nuclease (RuvC/YqgF family)
MMTSEDIARVKRGPADLEERIEQLEKQKEILKSACKKAGETIKSLTKKAQEAEGEMMIVKGIGMNSPEMRAAKARIEELERDNKIFKEDIDRLSEDKHNLETLLRK